ncbi:hypothetical protein AOX59_16490 [Lentibacillus amyloliquefaciens]|uniref:Uncharacterized protein n=1 Tax=Lentibacillus amyloliquefaciens TaxID=1472767 RepID=A0A0U4FQQ9_9BACI|nr:hypothetical protein AOX59_16490 [Lentibacillus amyloliquefaciens]
MKCEVARDCLIRGTTWARGRSTWAGASVIWAAPRQHGPENGNMGSNVCDMGWKQFIMGGSSA